MVTVGLKLNPYPLKSQWRKVESVVLEGVLASPIGSNFEEYLSEERQKKKGKIFGQRNLSLLCKGVELCSQCNREVFLKV